MCSTTRWSPIMICCNILHPHPGTRKDTASSYPESEGPTPIYDHRVTTFWRPTPRRRASCPWRAGTRSSRAMWRVLELLKARDSRRSPRSTAARPRARLVHRRPRVAPWRLRYATPTTALHQALTSSLKLRKDASRNPRAAQSAPAAPARATRPRDPVRRRTGPEAPSRPGIGRPGGSRRHAAVLAAPYRGSRRRAKPPKGGGTDG